MLQTELGVVADGIVGPVTLGAIASRKPAGLIEALCDRRLVFLHALSTFATFGRGWTARVAAVRAAALAAVTSTQDQRSDSMSILEGYRTYIVGAFMLLAGIMQLLGIEVPALEGASSGQLLMEALAIIFLRKGLKSAATKM